MARNLTVRQMKFAAAVAAGKTQAAAYKEAGYATNGKRRTAVRNAQQLAQHGEVRARIQELRMQLLPAPEDMIAVYEHGLATVIELTKSTDAKIRLDAAKWLCQEAERQEEKRKELEASTGRKKAIGDEVILAELRGIYRQAAAIEAAPLVLEASKAPDEE